MWLFRAISEHSFRLPQLTYFPGATSNPFLMSDGKIPSRLEIAVKFPPRARRIHPVSISIPQFIRFIPVMACVRSTGPVKGTV